MPRTLAQAFGFLMGMWLAFALSPLLVRASETDRLSPLDSIVEPTKHQKELNFQ